jgi:hypothetical protein
MRLDSRFSQLVEVPTLSESMDREEKSKADTVAALQVEREEFLNTKK